MQKLSKFTKIINISLLCSVMYVSAEASVYLKAGVGAMKYNSFKDTGGYEE